MAVGIKLDASALEMLVGDNETLKLEIISGVLNTYAKTHIKSLANSNAGRKIAQAITLQHQDLITESVGAFTNSLSRSFVLTDKVRIAINKAAREEADSVISKAVKLTGERYHEECLTKQIDRLVEIRINERLNEKFSEELDKRIARALSALSGERS